MDKQQTAQPHKLTLADKAAVAVGSAMLSVPAFAEGEYDVTQITTNLGLAVSAAATIGVTWLGFTAGIAIWRNLRAAAK